MKRHLLIGILIGGALLGLGYYLYRNFRPSISRATRLGEWLRAPQAHPDWMMRAGTRCGDAPFTFPTDGYIGFLWGDSFSAGHQHQGIDIFAGTGLGETPVITAYPGYLTRNPDWVSSVIVRIPSDPLHEGRQIWVYYTHMADPDGNSFISPEFPPGTYEQYITTGTLLGYQGNYSGNPGNPVGLHLHFSIVRDDGQGRFLNELEIANTIDPSLYLGLPLNAESDSGAIILCDP
jgi:murein DD-endopeptidase MepM/ murein hydrolase activator NlpD